MFKKVCKFLAVILAIGVVIGTTISSCVSHREVENLRAENEQLRHSIVGTDRDTSEGYTAGKDIDVDTPKAPETTVKTVIDYQIESNDYKVWLSVARNSAATESQLITVAKKASQILDLYYEPSNKETALAIAKALISNPSSTDLVLAQLLSSNIEEVRTLANNKLVQ